MLTIIYGLSDPRTNELRYIGKTQRSLKERLREHKIVAVGGRKALQQYCANWLRSLYRHGIDPVCTVLETVPDGGDWVEAEQFWIRYMRFVGCRLTNHTDGGEGLVGHKRPPEVIYKTASKLRGRSLPEESKQRMRQAWTPERKAANGARLRGTRMSDEARAKMRASAQSRYRSPEERAACAARLAKCNRNSPAAIAKQKAAWTPERRGKQSERFRKNVLKVSVC